MKTLYDRLSQADKDKLKQEAELYPAIVNSTIEELKNNRLPFQLTLNDAYATWTHLRNGKLFDLVAYIELFETEES